MIKRLYNYILHRRLHAEGVQRALTAPDKASQDSKPAMFAALALAELDKESRTLTSAWIETEIRKQTAHMGMVALSRVRGLKRCNISRII